MKKNKKYVLSLVFAICSLFAITSCEDMLKIDSERYVSVDGNDLSSPNDSVNSILGLLRGMQKVGDRYILLGEMRGDLLDVTTYTPANLRQLSEYKADSTNVYADPRDYYNLVNNCNYFISRTASPDSPLKKENAVAHAIRTWAYMQIATNWGKAYYFTKPLLTVNDTKENYPLVDMTELSDLLIADLEPYANAPYPQYKSVESFMTVDLLLPAKVLLGDLYLWRGSSTDDYEKAATYYAEFINSKIPPFDPNAPKKDNIISPQIRWAIDNFTNSNFTTLDPEDSWSSFTGTSARFNSSYIEFVSGIQMATETNGGMLSQIPTNVQYFGASSVVRKLWDDQSFLLHYIADPTNPKVYKNYSVTGDLRGKANLRTYQLAGSTATMDVAKVTTFNGLYKLRQSNHIMLYRMGLLYLRYAEAVNRAGYPNTAFAVLKYGLNLATKDADLKVPQSETTLPYVLIFKDPKFEIVKGIHSRGCGDTEFDASYKIGGTLGNLATKSDSINWVEEAICDELALETSFEGNRFGDLVRIASRRNDLDFFAKRIAAKNGGNSQLRDHLNADKKNWFLPEYSINNNK